MNSNIRSLGVIEFHNPNYSYPVTELLRTHEPIRQPENELREDGYQYRAFYISKIFHLLPQFLQPRYPQGLFLGDTAPFDNIFRTIPDGVVVFHDQLHDIISGHFQKFSDFLTHRLAV
jgi:hypothetical protein